MLLILLFFLELRYCEVIIVCMCLKFSLYRVGHKFGNNFLN